MRRWLGFGVLGAISIAVACAKSAGTDDDAGVDTTSDAAPTPDASACPQ